MEEMDFAFFFAIFAVSAIFANVFAVKEEAMPTRTMGGTTIHYEEAGKGTPLVLLHGFPLDSRIWTAQRAALADHCRVITPDFRGFRKSAASQEPFTLETL